MVRRDSGQIPVVKLRQLKPVAHAFPAAAPTFEALFDQHARYVWTTLRRLGARPTELEDLTHDVFLQVFRHLADFDFERPVKPWLFGFALRVASQDKRLVRRRPEVAHDLGDVRDAVPSALDELLTEERRALARAALNELELNRRAVFILHEIDGCTIPSIAEGLAIPLATAYSRLRLARADFEKAARRLRARQRDHE
jgi:RNA polymerase sigma-70 factor (ECF subfamily)